MKGIKQHKNPRNDFYVFWCHYTADPKKCTEAWKVQEMSGQAQNDWNREYEIDFSSFVGKPVFINDFDVTRMVQPFEADKKTPIIRSWDFGYHNPAVTWQQFVKGVQLKILESNLGKDIDFRLYVRHIIQQSALLFPGRQFLDCCDIAGTQRKGTGDEEVRILISEFGIIPRYKYSRVEPGIEQMRKLMNSTYKKEPCFMINDVASNITLIDALRGGYHYAEKRDGQPEKEIPHKDGYYDHLVDTVRYCVLNYFGQDSDPMGAMYKMAGSDIPRPKEDLW